MNTYRVSWVDVIDSKVVIAENKGDAWAKFCEGNDLATKHPKLHERAIEELEPVESTDDTADARAKAGAVSPVQNMVAEDAKEHITHMRSPERLQEIIAADTRSSVQHAAQARLKEIGGGS